MSFREMLAAHCANNTQEEDRHTLMGKMQFLNVTVSSSRLKTANIKDETSSII